MVRLLLVLILLIPNITIAKSLWGTISGCVSNPCTCHCSPDKITEYWPSITTVTKEGVTSSSRTSHKYKNYCNCPPYRKTKGRTGCLKQFDVPSGGCVSNLCAEYPGVSLSSYFNPHIRVRGQFCNAAACWTKATTLRYSGECLNWAGPYGLPLKRVCARIALSGDSKSNGLDDDGYTPKKHLDFEGHDQPDEIIYDDNGILVEYNPPKLCAYIDPSIFQPEGKLDLLDINPKNQPFQTGNGLSPIAQILISIVDSGMSLASTLPVILTKMEVPQSAVNAIKSLAQFNQNTLVSILKEFGQLNKTVSSRLGCVQIALGPFPPPYCNPLILTTGRPSIEQICPTVTSDTALCNSSESVCLQNDPNDITKCLLCRLSSTEDAPCVDSAIVNNAIQNTVRIGFNKITPVCSGAGSYTTDQCVNLSITSASMAHNTYSDLIPPGLIVNSPALIPGSGQTGFRAVYGTMMSGSIELSGSYNPSLPDCVSSSILNSTQCQTIYGINAGNFVDLSLIFPAIENGYNTNTLSATTPAILDPSGMMRTFTAAITRLEEPNDSIAKSLGIITLADSNDPTSITSPTQTTDQICVFDVTNISSPVAVGCVNRGLPPKPLVSSCNGYSTITAGGVSVACPVNDNNNPAIVVSLTVGVNTTAGALYIPSNNLSYSPIQLNLASNDYTAFVTDSYYNVAPFLTKGPSTSTTANYLYGSYLPDSSGNTAPYTISASGNINTHSNVEYLYGLEYQNGLYSGAVENKYISPVYKLFTCAEPSSVTPCPENIQNCVLTNLQSNNIVDCAIFNSLAEGSYSPLRKCYSTDKLCWSSIETPCSAGSVCPTIKNSSSCGSKDCKYVTSLSTLPTATGGGVSIYSCPVDDSTGDSASYCYYHSTMENICQITSDTANRILPAPTVGDILKDSEYYDYVAPVASTTLISNPDILSCSSYLSGLTVSPYSTNIMPCESNYSSCSIIEYFASPNPSQILTINSCTNTSGSAVQCYEQSNNTAICQLSDLLTVRYSSDPNASSPKISEYATVSSVVANKLLVSGSSVSCPEFLEAINSSYKNIQICNNSQTTCPIVNTISSTNPANTVNVRKCTESNTSNCYVNPTGLPINMNNLVNAYPNYTNICNTDMTNMSCNVVSDLTSTLGVILQQCTEVITDYCYSSSNSICSLGCDGAQEGVQSKICSEFISLMNIPSSSNLYGNIPECSNDASCPNNATLTITYGSGAVCSASTPVCSNVETVTNGGASLFTIKNCTSSGYNVTYNSVTSSVSGPNNYYCYTPTNSSCNVAINQSIVRTSSSGSNLPNPSTTNVPKICDIVNSTTTAPPPNTTPCSATNLNPSLCAIRTKTAIERGLCSDLMPYPKCNTQSSNNISWSTTDVGQEASGTCLGGTVTSDLTGIPPKRYCLADLTKDTATAYWGAVTGSCIPACGATIIGGSSFNTTLPGRTATGTCISGYINSNGSSPTAVCVNNSGNASSFGPITNPCQVANCASANINGAIIPTTAPDSTSANGYCNTGFTQNPAGPPKAYCRANTGTASTFDTVQNPCLVQGCNAATISSLNAVIPATAAGQRSVAGSCLPGYVPLDGIAPTAYCSATPGQVSVFTNGSNPCGLRPKCPAVDDAGKNNNDFHGHAIWGDENAYLASDNIWIIGSCRNNFHARCKNPDIYPRRQCILSSDGRSASWNSTEAICKQGFDSKTWCTNEANWRRSNGVWYAPDGPGY